MKNKIILALIMFSATITLLSAAETNDTTSIFLREITVTANKVPIQLISNPSSISLVTPDMLSIMPRSTAVDEALRLVPGVRIDNQHNGERVHLSIRGQGILTERGLRGIGVLLDGIPINDPSGFAPDLYDVDWSSVDKIEVLRGSVSGIYGSGAAAGLLNITTKDGGDKPIGGEVDQTAGSNAYTKSFLQVNGKTNDFDYRVSYSRTDGDGYRQHQGFWSNKFYEKVNFQPLENLKITQIFSHVDYFQQNPEGLSLSQLSDPTQANPDAIPFNEYQKTNRTTNALLGTYTINENQDLQAYYFMRTWNYKETSNKAAEYRTYTDPGANLQYNLHFNTHEITHRFSIGSDVKWQTIDMHKLQSGSNPDRVDSKDETNIELDTLLANQTITQSSLGIYALYNLTYGNLDFMANFRYDDMQNDLQDKMLPLDSSKTSKDFSKSSIRLGASYKIYDELNVFTDWSQGFLPPSTEELANNPLGYNGFNTHLVPATSNCFEIGFRGDVGQSLYYEVTGFYMTTDNDFFRFKQQNRGNQEVFYGNAGNSLRKGVEAYVSYNILSNLKLQVAYTYSDFTYTSATIDPIYLDTNYVLTTPPAPGQWLPNCPRHQFYAELNYKLFDKLSITFGTSSQSQWAIYTDANVYSGKADPTIYQNWQDGFTLFNASVSYLWNIWSLNGEVGFYVKNLTDQTYMAFTEPDPDGNSYQPGPKREFFGTVKINF
jgi:iron complex outermembrane receptor protein